MIRPVHRRYNLYPQAQLHSQAHPHQCPQQPAPTSVSVPPPQPQASALAVFTNARLASFSVDDTIRVRHSPSSSILFSPVLSLPAHSNSRTPTQTHSETKMDPETKEARSPVNDLFAFPTSL
ncbi:hypothetical protein DFH09DRAFT_1369551 [Mycena vulgaris]|nr:hypothetical protein DFH09DRAFT_1369551 [Mycena vulgaris]